MQNVHLSNLLISHQCLPNASRCLGRRESKDVCLSALEDLHSAGETRSHDMALLQFVHLCVSLGYMTLLIFDRF